MNEILYKKVIFISILFVCCVSFCSCASSDADIQAKVEKATAFIPGIIVDVNDDTVTLSGIVGSRATEMAVLTAVNQLKNIGIQAVVDNVAVEEVPVKTLASAVSEVVDRFVGINATVRDSIVMLSGQLSKDSLEILKQALAEVHPKQVNISSVEVK